MTPNPKARRGYALLEMMAYAAILGLLINLVMSVMVNGQRLNAAGVATLDRLKNAGDIQQTFTRDIKTAVAVADTALQYKTSANQLVLELPAAENQPRYVVYGLLKSNRRLDRLVFTLKDGSNPDIESFRTFPLDIEGFRVEQPAPGLVAVELDADVVGNRPVPPGVRRKPPVTYRFTAAARSRKGGAA